MPTSTNISELQNDLLQLQQEKSKIEVSMKQSFDILEVNAIGMHEPLVDQDGFPRNDIDVYQVRHARHRIICLQNDHKDIMLKIEAALHRLHARLSGNTAEISLDTDMHCEDEQLLAEPFALVTMVSPGSPADICGLQANDMLLEFGSVNQRNFKSMQDVAVVVHHSTGRKIAVLVKRKGVRFPLNVDLLPQPWSGEGLIGCKIDPLPSDTVER